MAERITFQTVDGVVIVGDWFPAPTVLGAAILLHAMPDTRTSWGLFQRELAKMNIASLAIDLRGHGESTQSLDGAVLDYREFTDEDHRATALDVSAAVDWVQSRQLELDHIVLGGASIGANLVLQELATEPKLAGAFLLSPGANYHGVDAMEAIGSLAPHQNLYVVSSSEDTESFADSQQLVDLAPVERKQFVPYKNAGHGIELFATDRALMGKIAAWVSEVIRG